MHTISERMPGTRTKAASRVSANQPAGLSKDDKRRAARYAKATGADKSSEERFAGMTRRPASRRAA
jgi:hypothetical protein